jgi:HEAT repeat protein
VQQVERLGADGSPDEVYLAPLAKLLADPDPQTRGLAALALSRHVVACKGKVPEGVVAPLVLGVRDENPHIAAYCDRTLSALGERALPQVQAALGADQPRAQRLAALEGCRHLVTNPACRAPVESLLWGLLAERDAAVRDRAFVLLQTLRAEHPRPPFRNIPVLAAALGQDNARIRALAAAQVVTLDEAAFPLLADLLDDPRRFTRIEAATILGQLLERGLEPEPDQTPTLSRQIDRLKGPETEEVRAALARVARKQAPPPGSAITRVDEALALMVYAGTFDNSPAYKLIAPIEEEAVKVLVDRLRAEDPKIQAAAAAALRPIYMGPRITPSGKALVNLGFALRSPNLETAQEVAQTVRYALRPTRKVPPTLLDALRNALSVESIVLRVRCSFALAACGAQAEGTLIVLLQDRNQEVQLHAARAISLMVVDHRIAVPGTLPHLKRLGNSPDSSVREAATQALDDLQRLLPGGQP